MRTVVAYKQPLRRECYKRNCEKPAKWAVYRRDSSPIGEYCFAHAEEALVEQKLQELKNSEKRFLKRQMDI